MNSSLSYTGGKLHFLSLTHQSLKNEKNLNSGGGTLVLNVFPKRVGATVAIVVFFISNYTTFTIIPNVMRFLAICLFIRYTLLTGRPPFETMSLKETYTRIKKNQYVIPSRISKTAGKLIQKFLSSNPQCRPCLHTVCETDEFFVAGFVPSSLPSSCCVVPPRFTALHQSFPNSDQKVTIKSSSNERINYVLTKLHLNDESTSGTCQSKWTDKETASPGSSPSKG